MSQQSECQCDHAETSHYDEDGFWDVRSRRGACAYIGCPCERFERRLVPWEPKGEQQ